MFSSNKVDMSFLLLSTWFLWSSRGELSENLLLLRFCCQRPLFMPKSSWWGVRGVACVYDVGACVYGVGACVHNNPKILVSAPDPLGVGAGAWLG